MEPRGALEPTREPSPARPRWGVPLTGAFGGRTGPRPGVRGLGTGPRISIAPTGRPTACGVLGPASGGRYARHEPDPRRRVLHALPLPPFPFLHPAAHRDPPMASEEPRPSQDCQQKSKGARKSRDQEEPHFRRRVPRESHQARGEGGSTKRRGGNHAGAAVNGRTRRV